MYVHVPSCFSRVQLFATPWTVAHQAPLSIRFSRQEYWSGLPCPPPGDLPNPGFKPTSPMAPTLQADSLPRSHLGKPTREQCISPTHSDGTVLFASKDGPCHTMIGTIPKPEVRGCLWMNLSFVQFSAPSLLHRRPLWPPLHHLSLSHCFTWF